MCDTLGGNLILCFPVIDSAGGQLINRIREGQIEHVTYVESLRDRLERMHLELDPSFAFDLHLVKVPLGSEIWKSTNLQFFYKHEIFSAVSSKKNYDFRAIHSRSDYQFMAAPNHILRLSAGPKASRVVSAATYQFTPFHRQFKNQLGLPVGAGNNRSLRVLLLDSGLAADSQLNVSAQRNFVDPRVPTVANDDHGHGTAIATLVNDLLPDVEYVIYKVADSTGRISEWDAVAALAARSDAHVVNLSLQFGLMNRACEKCGRESHSSRSSVFENVVAQFSGRPQHPVVVAAAGNDGVAELSYPARFGSVLAVGSMNSRRALSSDSNYGNSDEAGDPHRNHYVLPGGERLGAQRESILVSDGGKQEWFGTSFASAYATSLVGNLLRQQGLGLPLEPFLDQLRLRADHGFPGYDPLKHGNGILRM